MQSSMITIRALSRLMQKKFSTFLEPQIRVNPHFISVVCGFPKDLRSKYQIGKFGDDAWFTSTNKTSDVIGECRKLCKNKLDKEKIPCDGNEMEDGYWFFFLFALSFSHVTQMGWRMKIGTQNSKNINVLRKIVENLSCTRWVRFSVNLMQMS